VTLRRDYGAAITGIGLVTGFGVGRAETWRRVRARESAVRRLDLDGTRILGAPAPASDQTLSAEPTIVMALEAAREALSDARIAPGELPSTRAACTVSSSKGGMKSLLRLHRAFLDGETPPADFWELVSPSSPGTLIAREFGIQGPVINYAAACATGVHAVIAGLALIRSGETDVVLAGATDASLVQPVVAAFERMGVLSRRLDDPAGACRPFDRTRDGFAIGEGAAVLVLESMERANARPGRAYVRVVGSSWGAEAYDLARVSTGPSSIGPLIRKALDDAGILPREVDYVNAHGTGTVANDPVECASIREALGEHATGVPVSSLKPAVGHCLGAAGGVELALTVLAMRDGFLPPTLNLTDPDPECRLNHVPPAGLERDVSVAVKIAAGFGGHIGIVVLRRGDRAT
jgi:3-oxoacyl-(acyl-carrier-protein) synthase